MGVLEDLAASLVTNEAQKAIAGDNTYYNLKAVPDQLGGLVQNLATQAPGRFSTGDLTAGSLVTGLLSGLLGGAGDNYQTTLTDRYSNIVKNAIGGTPSVDDGGLSSGLFKQANQSGQLFRAQRTLKQLDAQEALTNELAKANLLEGVKSKNDLKKELAKQAIENPRRFAKALPTLQTLLGGDSVGIGGKPEDSNIVEAPTKALPKIEVGSTPIASNINGNIDFSGGESVAPQELIKLFNAKNSASAEDVTPSALNQYGFESLENRRKAKINEYLDLGLGDKEASDSAKSDLNAELEADKKSYGKVQEARTKATDLLSMADTVDQVLSSGLETGTGAGLIQGASQIGDFFGVPGANERATQGNLLNSVKAKIIGMARVPGSGSTSDFEAKAYLQAGPSLDKTTEANLEIARRMRQVAERGRDYADFVDLIQGEGGTIKQADQLWSKYERSNPLWIKENGKLVPNQNIVPYSQFDFINGVATPTAQATQQSQGITTNGTSSVTPQGEQVPQETGIGGEFIQGVKETPSVIKALFSPSTYKEGFKDAETGVRTLGTGASMLAGAGTGATFGSALGPIGALFGGAVGGGLGALGFGTAERAGRTAVGQDVGREVLPDYQDAKEASRLTGQGLGLGAVAKVGGKLFNKVSKVPERVAQGTENVIENTKKDLLGVRGADIEKSFKESGKKFLDENGIEVEPTNSSQTSTIIDRSVKVVDQDGLFDSFTNDAKTNLNIFDKKTAEAGQQIRNLHQEANLALQDLRDQLTPIQRKQFPLTRDPKTGKGGFELDFAPAKRAINQIAEADPKVKPALTKNLNSVIENWNKSSRSYDLLQKRKEVLGKSTNFSNASDAAWNDVKKVLYGIFSEKQGQAFDFAMSKVDPSKVGALAEANKKFFAYKNLEPIINKTGSKGYNNLNIDLGNVIGTRTLGKISNAYPATKLKVANTAQELVGKPSNLPDWTFSQDPLNVALGNLLKGGSRSGASLYNQSNQPTEQIIDEEGALMEPQTSTAPATQDYDSIVQQAIERIGKKKDNSVEDTMPKDKEGIKRIEAQIDKDPYWSTIYEIESGRNPNAKNPNSSAKGAFQLIDQMSRKLKVDPLDIEENWNGAKTLDADNARIIKKATNVDITSDPALRYSAHFLGAPVMIKLLSGADLSQKEKAQVAELQKKVLPKLDKIYQSKIGGSDFA